MLKKWMGFSVFVFLLVLAVTWGGIVFSQPEFYVNGMAPSVVGREKFVPDEIIVKFRPGVSNEVIKNTNSRHGASVTSTSRFAGFKRLRIPKGKTVEEMVAIYSRNPNVEYAEPNFKRYALMAPTDPLYSYQWHFHNSSEGGIDMEPAWDISTGSSVIVAVLDSGVAYENYGGQFKQAPDLAQTNFVPGYDFVDDDTHANDANGHGTHVTGTIAQSTNNDEGVAGVAFNCSIMPIRFLGPGGGTTADEADGIYFATNNGAKVINMSFGGFSTNNTEGDALAYAYDNGVTLVAAAGNEYEEGNPTSYPAAYDDYVIAVGATRIDKTRSYYSNTGSYLDIVAPGGDTMIDQNNDGYVDGILQQTFGRNPKDFGYWFYQGTSMACPHVSGVAALLIANGTSGPAAVREALENAAIDLGPTGRDDEYGHGLLNAHAALNYQGEPNDPPVADAGGPYIGVEDQPVSFDGSGSSDPDGDPLTYSWDFGDGGTGSGATPTHTYTVGGNYTVTLTVNDGRGGSDSNTTTATITEVNDPPVADAGPDQAAYLNEAVSFDGSGSSDPDGTIVSYSWDFGDGDIGTGETTGHTYTAIGIYTTTLTVTDNEGVTGQDQATVTVQEEPSNAVHVTDINMSLSTRTAGKNEFTKALATVTIVDADNNPVQGATVYGSWSGATSDIDSGLTDSTGKVTLESDEIKNAKSGTTFTFTVDDITKSGWTYDSSANAEMSDSILVP